MNNIIKVVFVLCNYLFYLFMCLFVYFLLLLLFFLFVFSQHSETCRAESGEMEENAETGPTDGPSLANGAPILVGLFLELVCVA